MKRTVSLFLLLALLLSALTGCFGTPANSDPGTTAKETTCESTYETYEKVYVKDLTTDLDFSDNEILLIVQPQFNFTEYTPKDFPEADCIDVREIFSVKEGVLGRVLLLTLATHSKQNVIDCIYKLQLRDDIYCVNPNLYDKLESVPNDTLVAEQ